MKEYSAEELAEKVLREIKEKEGKITYPIDPYKLLKENNVIISFSDFDKLEGIIIKDENDITIVGINKNRRYTRQRFTAAHEYCHYIKDLNKEKHTISQIECAINSKSERERYADKFASCLLMPKYEIKRLCNKYKNKKGYVEFESITLIAEYFGVSFKSCINRIAYDLHMIEGDIAPFELNRRIAKYRPEMKKKELLKECSEMFLIDHMINSLSYNMINLESITGIKFINEYIYYDNKIEGLTISSNEVSYILTDLRYNKEKSEFYNAENEEVVMTLGNLSLQEYVLTTNDRISIKKCQKLHNLLYSYSAYPEYSGNYRTGDAIIRNGSIQPIDWHNISNEIDKLDIILEEILKEKDKYSISEYVDKITYVIYRFIVIHPFHDGNGRVSRALLNWLLKEKHLPPIYIDEENRKEYYEALSNIDKFNDYTKLSFLIKKRIINTMVELHNYLF